jgi:hypothetical protein
MLLAGNNATAAARTLADGKPARPAPVKGCPVASYQPRVVFFMSGCTLLLIVLILGCTNRGRTYHPPSEPRPGLSGDTHTTQITALSAELAAAVQKLTKELNLTNQQVSEIRQKKAPNGDLELVNKVMEQVRIALNELRKSTSADFETSLTKLEVSLDGLRDALRRLPTPSNTGTDFTVVNESIQRMTKVLETTNSLGTSAKKELEDCLPEIENCLNGLSEVLSRQPASPNASPDLKPISASIQSMTTVLGDLKTALANYLQAPPKPSNGTQAVSAAFIGTGILWLTQMLVAYATRRLHLIRTLKVDIAYRAGSAANAYYYLLIWRHHFRLFPEENANLPAIPEFKAENAKPLEIPVLTTPVSEEHVVYANIQAQMVECLWGAEVADVRITYRWLGLIETRIASISQLSKEIVDVIHDEKQDAKRKLAHLKDLVAALDDLMLKHRDYLEEFFKLEDITGLEDAARADFLDEPGSKPSVKELNLTRSPGAPTRVRVVPPYVLRKRQSSEMTSYELSKVERTLDSLQETAEKLFIPMVPAYGTQLVAPLLTIAWFVVLVLSLAFPGENNANADAYKEVERWIFWLLLTLLTVVALWPVIDETRCVAGNWLQTKTFRKRSSLVMIGWYVVDLILTVCVFSRPFNILFDRVMSKDPLLLVPSLQCGAWLILIVGLAFIKVNLYQPKLFLWRLSVWSTRKTPSLPSADPSS